MSKGKGDKLDPEGWNAPILVSHGYENIYERGFCNGLSDSGIPFILISSDRTDYAGLRQGTRTVNLRGSQEEGRSRWRKLTNLVRYHFRLVTFVVRHRPTVLHMIGLIHPPLLCGVIEGLIFRICCGRYVLTVHDLLPHDRHTRWNALMFGWSFRLADVSVVHTPRMKDALMRRHGIDARRIVVMEHGIEPQVKSAAVVDRPSRSDPLQLLFFGKVLRYKGVDVLLEALQTVPMPFRLNIAGGVWDEDLRRELRARIESHPHRDAIHWSGQYVPEDEIAGLFAQADILVLPYRHIDQSGILFQGLRHGVPVVATRVGSLSDYVSSEVGEVCGPGDPEDLRAAIVRLATRLPSMSRVGIKRMAARYDWSRTVAPLRDAYGFGSAHFQLPA